MATLRAQSTSRGFKERLFSAVGAHFASHSYWYPFLVCMYVCVCVVSIGDQPITVKVDPCPREIRYELSLFDSSLRRILDVAIWMSEHSKPLEHLGSEQGVELPLENQS